jgi:hypothetical protein
MSNKKKSNSTTVYSELIERVKNSFSKIQDKRQKHKIEISLRDYLMSGIALFILKCPSLLQFDKEFRTPFDDIEKNNLKKLFDIKKVPSDTSLREVLDNVEPDKIKPAFKQVFKTIKKHNHLKEFKFYGSSILLGLDGTGFFSSNEISCSGCMTKEHSDGTITYYHQALCAAFMHPESKQVIPLAPEPISNKDGQKKNDCERNAAKRILKHIREEHPNLNITITEDALSSNVPHILELQKYGFHYILGIKKGNAKKFIENIEKEKKLGNLTNYVVESEQLTKEYKFINNMKMQTKEGEVTVNYFEVTETNKKGDKKFFSWITDYEVTESNVEILEKGGRCRWKIENETINTLKNQGYNFEHNFGHGKKYLCNTFALLMMLAFAIDQASEICCDDYKKARIRFITKRRLWEKMRTLFGFIPMQSFNEFIKILSGEFKIQVKLDTG